MNIVEILFLNILLFVMELNSSSLITITTKEKKNNILPFTSIKINNDEIFFTKTSDRTNWYKLLSINNIREDVFIKKAKNAFGEKSCNFEIECYKYNLILNFPSLFKLVSGISLPKLVDVEYSLGEKEDNSQRGVKFECTSDNYKINEKYKEENINGKI